MRDMLQIVRGGTYQSSFQAFSVMLFQEREEVDRGGKIILPHSALERLTALNVTYPMLFEVCSLSNTDKKTHCGVLEFTAQEEKAYFPSWMMKNLLLEEGDAVFIKSTTLSVATYSKFKPLSADFLDITNPKAVLEQVLRNFSCLTTGDVVAVHYNNRVYELLVVDTKPDKAISIIECDMQTDFDEPTGYVDQTPRKKSASSDNGEEAQLMVDSSSLPQADFEAFQGSGKRLAGPRKSKKADLASGDKSDQVNIFGLDQIGIPNYEWKPGSVKMQRVFRTQKPKEEKPLPDFTAFSGSGQALREQVDMDDSIICLD